MEDNIKRKKLNKHIINKINQLILRAYPVLLNDITDEHWALNIKKISRNKIMNKKYLLIMKSKYGDFKTRCFYTLEETKITANVENENDWLTTIFDLENENIKWQGVE